MLVALLAIFICSIEGSHYCQSTNVVRSNDDNSNCQFIVYHPSFVKDVLGNDARSRIIAQRNYSFAHEGVAYFPKTKDFFFNTNRLGDTSSSNQFINVMKINLDTLRVETFIDGRFNNQIYMANGMTESKDGKYIIACSQGQIGVGGSIVKIDPKTARVENIVDNWFGLDFNSPNDVVVSHKDGSIWFTDPDYGNIQLFRDPPQVGRFLWRYDVKSGNLQVLEEEFVKPNGLAFSPDEKKLYVSDTGYFDEKPCCTTNPLRPRTVYEYDVIYSSDGYPKITNRRVFAASESGAPDGIKVDCNGNVYVGQGNGITVYKPSGQLIGQIRIPEGTANFGFARGSIIALAETRIYQIKLNIQCNNRHY